MCRLATPLPFCVSICVRTHACIHLSEHPLTHSVYGLMKFYRIRKHGTPRSVYLHAQVNYHVHVRMQTPLYTPR